MTIICAYDDGGSIWIGSDRQSTYGESKLDGGPKWRVWPDVGEKGIALGWAGPTRVSNLIDRCADDIISAPGPNDVSDILKQAIINDGWKLQENEGEGPSVALGFILVMAGAISLICCDFTMVPVRVGQFVADGSGELYAMGAASAVKQIRGPDPVAGMLRIAIEGAIENNVGCGGEPWIESLPS